MFLPSFSDIPTLYEAQDEVLCGDMDRARRVTSIATCGAAHSAEAEEESLKRSAELVSCMVYRNLLKEVDPTSLSAEHDHTLSIDLLEENRLQGVGAFIYVEKAEHGKIFLSTLSAPILSSFKDEDNPSSVVGLRNNYSCTRTEKFDVEGLLEGDIRWSILSFDGGESTSPARLRYISSSAPKKLQQKRMELLSHEVEDNGKKRRDRANYRRLMSGIAFNEAKTLVGNWIQALAIPMTSFEFTLPCLFPLPFEHTVTPINPIEFDSTDPKNILTSFIAAGISPDAKLEYLLGNPLFITWIHALLNDPSSCIPTSISSVPFGNFPSRVSYT